MPRPGVGGGARGGEGRGCARGQGAAGAPQWKRVNGRGCRKSRAGLLVVVPLGRTPRARRRCCCLANPTSRLRACLQLIASGAAELRRQANGLTGAVNGRKGLARAKSGQNNRYGVGQAPAKSEEDDDKILRVTDTDITDAQAVLEIMPLSESEAWGPLHPEAIAAAAAASEARRTVANGASGSDSDGIGYGVPTNGGSAARGGSSTGTSSGGEPNDGGVADMDTENGKAS